MISLFLQKTGDASVWEALRRMFSKSKVALIYGSKVDKAGNISFVGTTRNTNIVMATAADVVIVEAEEFVDGYLNPNEVVIPGLFIDYIVKQKD